MARVPQTAERRRAAPAPQAAAVDVGGQTVRRRDAAATKARILSAAVDAFATLGMDARIEDIAEGAGTNRALAYYYFGSKEGLYLAALEATFLQLMDKEREIDFAGLDPLEAVVALVIAKFEHYRGNPRYLQLLNVENMNGARFLRSSARLAELHDPLVGVFGRILAEGRERGIFRPDVDPVELYVSIIGLGYFAFANRHTLAAVIGVDPSAAQSVAVRRRMVVDMVTAYLTAPSADERTPKPQRRRQTKMAGNIPATTSRAARKTQYE